jgi:ribosomal protein S14
MKAQYTEDKNRRRLVKSIEQKRANIKQGFYNTKENTLESRILLGAKLSKINRNSSKTRVRNRCILTGRSRAVSSEFSISRIKFRERALNAQITGVHKGSW